MNHPSQKGGWWLWQTNSTPGTEQRAQSCWDGCWQHAGAWPSLFQQSHQLFWVCSSNGKAMEYILPMDSPKMCLPTLQKKQRALCPSPFCRDTIVRPGNCRWGLKSWEVIYPVCFFNWDTGVLFSQREMEILLSAFSASQRQDSCCVFKMYLVWSEVRCLQHRGDYQSFCLIDSALWNMNSLLGLLCLPQSTLQSVE